ncbi:MAG: oligopeptide transporter, OPT family [bacterium]|nr:oligopeptide transporter, OPT family [bacterium]
MNQSENQSGLKPYIPSEQLIPQFSVKAAVLGILLAMVFGAANAYMGLKIGMTVTASIPAAVMGMAIMRGVLRRGNVLEVNMVQTIASSGESLAAGIVFTMPALIFLGLEITWWKVFSMSLVGGLLGILVMIPLRRNLMVEEHETLPFPEGTACAKVILAGEKRGDNATYVFSGIALGGLFRLLADSGLHLWREVVQWSSSRMHQATIGFELSPILLGVGYLIGPRTSAIMFSGGLLGWVVLIPLLHYMGTQADFILYPGTTPLGGMDADTIWDNYIRYIGAGGVAFGGLLSLFKVMPTVLSSFKRVLVVLGKQSLNTENLPRVERDLDLRVVLGVSVFCILAMLFLPVFGFGFWGTLICIVFSFFFVAVSARMVGMIGSTAQPVSGMTIAALLATAALFYQLGMRGEAGQSATIMVAAVVCIAICMSGDIAQDLKTGALLGATPFKQQLGEIIGTLSFALIGGSVVILLHQAYTLGSAELPTPQGRLMADLVRGVMGGQLPWTLILTGAGIALCVELMGISALPFAIGLYLPITTSAPVIFGGLLAWVVSKRRMGSAATERGTLFGSGLIAGDALISVLLAVLAIIPFSNDPVTGEVRRVSDMMILRHPGPGLLEDVLAIVPFLILAGVFWFIIQRKRA